ncbi:hypothetical protein JCM17845_12410 [Iodidimonas gelatinilytica]|uniref:Protein YjdM C-terminal domain-containing protein n=1 Tax=Iodidimonas gelatinilytica TaxID=1236966 RepID=A0A5A7MXM3_9PROT|nr:alkylphosphonate utilization protein [Iodidimonas gelatinilytica]GER00618.1 hypothetical protein JCM17845_12410 [Iodidimonas gelatinilytica]
MTDAGDGAYVYDEATGEWLSPEEAAEKAAKAREVRDAVGNVLADGDSVTLIKDLKVKGAGQTLKRGTVIKSIRLTDDNQEIDCRHEASRASFCAPSLCKSDKLKIRRQLHKERQEARCSLPFFVFFSLWFAEINPWFQGKFQSLSF